MEIFTNLKLCLADAIHNFKWVKIIQISQNEGQRFLLIGVTFYIALYMRHRRHRVELWVSHICDTRG